MTELIRSNGGGPSAINDIIGLKSSQSNLSFIDRKYFIKISDKQLQSAKFLDDFPILNDVCFARKY